VLVDGADVREVQLDSLRHAMALVTDDPFLFSASVHENIAYARPDASREDVQTAARRAQADEFVTALPDGYDTLIGERGLTLSGGHASAWRSRVRSSPTRACSSSTTQRRAWTRRPSRRSRARCARSCAVGRRS